MQYTFFERGGGGGGVNKLYFMRSANVESRKMC